MRSMTMRYGVAFCTFAALFFVCGRAKAQTASTEKPPLYTYVSEWAVPRSMWADYQKMEAAGNDALNKLVADGTLVSYGDFTVLNHQEGRPTHGSWFQANSMTNLLKVLESVRTAPDATSPVFAASKHWDYVLESHIYGAHSGTFKNGYLRVAYWKYKPTANDPNDKILKSTLAATMEKLLAEGALHSYQIDFETIHSGNPSAFYLAFVSNGAEGLDKFSAAIEDASKNSPAYPAAFASLVEDEGHFDTLMKVDTMNHK